MSLERQCRIYIYIKSYSYKTELSKQLDILALSMGIKNNVNKNMVNKNYIYFYI